MGGARLSKFLIQFSVDGWGCVPFLLFDLGPNYEGGNEDNGDLLQKVPCMHCYTQCPQPCSRPLPTHASVGDSCTFPGQVWVSLLWGHCSFLLGPGRHKVLFASSKSLFPQFCVSSGGSMVGLMRPLPRGLMPYPCLLHPEPCPRCSPLQTCTSTGDARTPFCLSLCEVSGSWCAQGLFEPSEHL